MAANEFKKLEIQILKNPSHLYKAGDKIIGFIQTNIADDHQLDQLLFSIKGQAIVDFDNVVRDPDIILEQIIPLGNAVGPNGHQSYPFELTLPKTSLLSSFESIQGRVKYELITQMTSTPLGSKHAEHMEEVMPISVIGVLDLSQVTPDPGQVFVIQFETNPGCWCCKSGLVSAEIKLHRTGYLPGEVVHLEYNLHNASSKPLEKVTVKLIQTIKMAVDDGKSFDNERVLEISEDEGVFARAGEIVGEMAGEIQIRIPEDAPITNLGGCRVIQLNYFLKVEGLIDKKFENMALIPITVGSIPLHSS